MKLYSDEEANYLCRDFRDIPFELRQMLFDKSLDDNHISQFNPAVKKKRDFSTPANINLFSEAVGANYGIDSVKFRNEYNKLYDKNVKNKFDRVIYDRKREDERAQYENVLAMLRNPKAQFALYDMPRGDAYSDAIVTDINGMILDLDEAQSPPRRGARDRRSQAERDAEAAAVALGEEQRRMVREAAAAELGSPSAAARNLRREIRDARATLQMENFLAD